LVTYIHLRKKNKRNEEQKSDLDEQRFLRLQSILFYWHNPIVKKPHVKEEVSESVGLSDWQCITGVGWPQ